MTFQRGLERGHEFNPVVFESIDIGAEGATKGGQPAIGGRKLRERVVGTSQQVQKSQEPRRVPEAKVINQRPRLGVEIALVTSSVAHVADQGLQPRTWLNPPPVG